MNAPRFTSATRRFALALALVCPFANAASFSYLQQVSSIRRIEVQQALVPFPTPTAPFSVRAVDSAGAPVPGFPVFTGTGADPGFPRLFDKFGARGFNTGDGYFPFNGMGGGYNQYWANTDVNGLVHTSGRYFDPAPSAYVVVAAPLPPSAESTWKYFSVVAVRQTPAGRPSVVLEYFNTINGHYFNTISQQEIDALEAGKFVGWKRSTGAFIAYETQADAPEGTLPVCRFFSSKFTSHFYTADVAECNLVERDLGEDWVLETRAAFYINVPDKLTGTCGAGLQPIHRMFNNKAIPNHRYIADAQLRDRMTGAGWVAEGFGGANAVMLCTPA